MGKAEDEAAQRAAVEERQRQNEENLRLNLERMQREADQRAGK